MNGFGMPNLPSGGSLTSELYSSMDPLDPFNSANVPSTPSNVRMLDARFDGSPHDSGSFGPTRNASFQSMQYLLEVQTRELRAMREQSGQVFILYQSLKKDLEAIRDDIQIMGERTLAAAEKPKDYSMMVFNELDKADYPDAAFWDEKDWRDRNSSTNTAGVTKSKAVSTNEPKELPKNYLTNLNGEWVGANAITAVTKYARSVFSAIDNDPTEKTPATWARNASPRQRNFFRLSLESTFPFLKLCSYGWKVEQLAKELYPHFRQHRPLNKRTATALDNPCNNSPQDSVSVEADITSLSMGKRRRKDTDTTLSGSVKRAKDGAVAASIEFGNTLENIDFDADDLYKIDNAEGSSPSGLGEGSVLVTAAMENQRMDTEVDVCVVQGRCLPTPTAVSLSPADVPDNMPLATLPRVNADSRGTVTTMSDLVPVPTSPAVNSMPPPIPATKQPAVTESTNSPSTSAARPQDNTEENADSEPQHDTGLRDGTSSIGTTKAGPRGRRAVKRLVVKEGGRLTARSLCAREWLQANEDGLESAFNMYWKQLPEAERNVFEQRAAQTKPAGNAR